MSGLQASTLSRNREKLRRVSLTDNRCSTTNNSTARPLSRKVPACSVMSVETSTCPRT